MLSTCEDSRNDTGGRLSAHSGKAAARRESSVPRGPCWLGCAPWWPQGGGWPLGPAGGLGLGHTCPLSCLPSGFAWRGHYHVLTHQASRKAAVLTFLSASSFEGPGSLSPGQGWWTFGGQYAGLCFKPLHPPITRFTQEGDPFLLFPIPNPRPCPSDFLRHILRGGGSHPPCPLPLQSPFQPRATRPTKPDGLGQVYGEVLSGDSLSRGKKSRDGPCHLLFEES